jgi:hypothetical protein
MLSGIEYVNYITQGTEHHEDSSALDQRERKNGKEQKI